MTKQNRNIRPRLGKGICSLLLMCVVSLLSHCSEKAGSDESRDNQLIPAVEAVQAREGTLPLTERLTGIVRAKNQIEIYAETSATIVAVYVENGDIVQKGQPLVRLRDKEFRERLKQARASYQIALAQAKQAAAQQQETQAELKRAEALAAKQLTSPSELETVRTQAISVEADMELAEARVAQAQATVDEREETLARTVIKAPITGTVGNRNAEVGMLVTSNTQLFTLGQLDQVRVEVILTDRMLNYIEEGQRAEIHTENSPFGSMSAGLSRISPFLHPVTHSTDADIDMANPDGRLKPGMFVAVDIYYGESERATLVPLSALYDNPVTGSTGIYVSQESLSSESVGAANSDKAVSLTAPVSFEFLPVDVVAKGRMEAGVRGLDTGQWVVTLGQDLLAGKSGSARVRTVNWGWVEKLQKLQRQDLLQEVMQPQQAAEKDTTANNQHESHLGVEDR